MKPVCPLEFVFSWFVRYNTLMSFVDHVFLHIALKAHTGWSRSDKIIFSSHSFYMITSSNKINVLSTIYFWVIFHLWSKLFLQYILNVCFCFFFWIFYVYNNLIVKTSSIWNGWNCLRFTKYWTFLKYFRSPALSPDRILWFYHKAVRYFNVLWQNSPSISPLRYWIDILGFRCFSSRLSL